MAKLTIEEAKLKLQPIQKAIEGLKTMALEVPASLQQEFERLVKIITGNSSANLATTFNEKIAKQINGSAEFVEFLAGQIGTKARLTVVVVTAEDGTKSIQFEGASAGSSGGQKSGTTSGGTKASTAFNNYKVVVLETNPNAAAYAEKSGNFSTGAKTVEFILNNGVNPYNLGADWQAGNSMPRAIESLLKMENFGTFFTLERTYVAPVKKADAPAVETAPAAE